MPEPHTDEPALGADTGVFDAIVFELAELARSTGICVYAGAGLSMGPPTDIPSGAEVSRRIHAKLVPNFPQLASVEPSNLAAIADSMGALPGGADAIKRTAAGVAEFTTAAPSYGHRALALLLLEGAVDVFTTNWDDCIERATASPRDRVPAALREIDVTSLASVALFKIHGCATQPPTLLLSTEDLNNPPRWVTDQVRARLSSRVVVFVGIGDIAGYVKVRLEEAISDVGTPSNIRVVAPTIREDWSSSAWGQLVPTLDDMYRIDATANEFLKKLAAAYVFIVLGDHLTAVSSSVELTRWLTAASTVLRSLDPKVVLEWSRGAGVTAQRGRSVLKSAEMAQALVAIGKLAPNGFAIDRDRLVIAAGSDVVLDVLIAVGTVPSLEFRRAATRRLEELRSVGAPEPDFLVSGGLWLGVDSPLPSNIISDGEAADLIDGPLSGEPRIIRAEQVVES